MSYKEQIEQWFKKTWGGGLLLPDGWFGRPYDNIHQLTRIDENKGELCLILDDGQLSLYFFGKVKLSIDKKELVISNFDQLEFKWKEYGSMKPLSDKYESGLVKIVAPPGA